MHGLQLTIRLASSRYFSRYLAYYFFSCSDYVRIMFEDEFVEMERKVGSLNSASYLCRNVTLELNREIDDFGRVYQSRAIEQLRTRKHVGDFLLTFCCRFREMEREFSDELIFIQPSCFGGDTKAANVIFPSHSYANLVLKTSPPLHSWKVIPPFFNHHDFQYCDKKEDYVLFLGRMQDCKGATIILDLAKSHPEKRFVLAGYSEGSREDRLRIDDRLYDLTGYPNVKHVGHAKPELRREFLSKAKCLIQPSRYKEPFGFNVIEAYLSGTPVITTNWGAFLETVKPEATGFKCSSWGEFDDALKRICQIRPERCLAEGLLYTEQNLYFQYLRYFQELRLETCHMRIAALQKTKKKKGRAALKVRKMDVVEAHHRH